MARVFVVDSLLDEVQRLAFGVAAADEERLPASFAQQVIVTRFWPKHELQCP